MPTLVKNSDNRFNGNHPNGIDEGYTKSVNNEVSIPEVGECYYFDSLRTSTVTKIIHEDDLKVVFKTRNSTYTLTK